MPRFTEGFAEVLQQYAITRPALRFRLPPRDEIPIAAIKAIVQKHKCEGE